MAGSRGRWKAVAGAAGRYGDSRRQEWGAPDWRPITAGGVAARHLGAVAICVSALVIGIVEGGSGANQCQAAENNRVSAAGSATGLGSDLMINCAQAQTGVTVAAGEGCCGNLVCCYVGGVYCRHIGISAAIGRVAMTGGAAVRRYNRTGDVTVHAARRNCRPIGSNLMAALAISEICRPGGIVVGIRH